MSAILPHTKDRTHGDSAEGAATVVETWVRGLAKSPGDHVLHVRAPAAHRGPHTRGDSAEGAATVMKPRVRWLAKSRSAHVLHIRGPATHRGSHTRRLSRGSSDSSRDAGSMAGKVTKRSCAACLLLQQNLGGYQQNREVRPQATACVPPALPRRPCLLSPLRPWTSPLA